MSNHPLHRKPRRDSIRVAVPQMVYGAAASCVLIRRTRPLQQRTAVLWRAAHEQGSKTWSGVKLTFEEFMLHVESLGQSEVPPYAEDLYLMAACRLARPLAFEALEHQHIVRLKALLTSLLRDASAVDDVLQEVRKRLVKGPASRASYAGTGPLGRWLRAMAVNAARDHLRLDAARRQREKAHASTAVCGPGEATVKVDDVLLSILRQGRASACLAAVQDTFRALQVRDRQLLHDYYFRGLSIDLLAPLYAVNRATVARRLRRSTGEIQRSLRRRMAALYPREDTRTLDMLAFAACQAVLEDGAELLGE